MSDAATLVVIRDVLLISGLALAIALLAYAAVRLTQDAHWNLEGNVLARPYNGLDVLVALGLLGLLAWGGLQGLAARQEGAKVEDLPDSMAAAGLLASAVILLLLALITVGYMTVFRAMNPAEMFGLRQMSMGRALGVSVGAVLLVLLGMGLVMFLLSASGLSWKGLDGTPQDTVKVFQNSGSPLSRVILGVLAVVVAPLCEELFFRGFLYGAVKRFTDRWFAAVFSALVFAAIHQHVGTLVPLFLLAIGFAMAYEATGCLLVPVFMHSLFNAGNLVALSLYNPS